MSGSVHTQIGQATSLRRIADVTGGDVDAAYAEVEVSSGAIGSQDVQVGGLFFAVPGTRAHGAAYAADSQAAAVMTDAEGQAIIAESAPDLPVVVVEDVRQWMGQVAAEIYGHPSRQLTMIGITGTSGKTTTSYLVERSLIGTHSVGLIGTTGTRINGTPVPTKLTTPEAPTLQALLARMLAEGVTHVVMEVSSHALELGRVDAVDFDVAAFTNLSQDHLDFHPTMEDYFRAKTLLFRRAQEGQSPKAVVCVDDEWGVRMASVAAEAGDAVVAVKTSDAEAEAIPTPHTMWQVESVEVAKNGRQDIQLVAGEQQINYSIGLAGSFNVANSAVAVACAAAVGEDISSATAALSDVQVPGRMQAIDAGQDFLAMVDYAHKPGAVAAVVATLADYLPDPSGRIGIVLGAGGNRDHDKRPKMGWEAVKIAHAVFVTDDNPRDEEPASIRAAVEAGARQGAEAVGRDVFISNIGDRRAAIRAAVEWARPGDAIVVAGKGHEQGQEVAGVMHEFDDSTELKQAIADLHSESADVKSES